MQHTSLWPLCLFLLACTPVSAEGLKTAVRWYATVALGQSSGGAVVDELRYTDGSTQTLKAGGGQMVQVGLLARLTAYPVDLSLSIGQHFDKDEAVNAEISFKRRPFEAIVYLRLLDNVRLGAGIRHLSHVRYSYNFENRVYTNLEFASTNGYLVEADWWISRSIAFALRRVREPLRIDTSFGPLTWDASHWAVLVRGSF